MLFLRTILLRTMTLMNEPLAAGNLIGIVLSSRKCVLWLKARFQGDHY